MSVLTEGSLEVKLPTYGQKKQQLWEQSEKRESVEWRSEKRKSQRRESKRKEDQRARKGRKVAKHCVFPMFCGSGGSKSPPKAAGAEPSAGMKDKQLGAKWREAHLEVNMQKTPQPRSTFGGWDVQKAHATWRKAHVEGKMLKSPQVRSTFGRSGVVLCGRRNGFCT